MVDLTRVLAGPFATQVLGDLGADIIKVEPPDYGDDTRHFPPHRAGESHYFVAINRSKRGMAIDLRQEAGRDVLRRLAATADGHILIACLTPQFWGKLCQALGRPVHRSHSDASLWRWV